MIYITGDTHGDFQRIFHFCGFHTHLTRDDIMIVLGDAGINYYGNQGDAGLKESIAKLPLTLFCIHGNHEMRPQRLPSYIEKTWRQGTVFVEKAYPNILFAKDGETFDFNGRQAIVIGGAYSVDKYYRLEKGCHWFSDEQPSVDIRRQVEYKLDCIGWKIDTVLTHTCPLKYEPAEVFLSFIEQSIVDKGTETWLDSIEERLAYKRWFCGHYHTEKRIAKLNFLYKSIEEF